MQGLAAIRWSGSILTATALHVACWFWADQILPPDMAISPASHRLSVSFATNTSQQKEVSNTPAALAEETPSQNTVQPEPETVVQEDIIPEVIVKSSSIALPELKKPSVTKDESQKISVKPKWRPKTPKRLAKIEPQNVKVAAPIVPEPKKKIKKTTPVVLPPAIDIPTNNEISETKKLSLPSSSQSVQVAKNTEKHIQQNQVASNSSSQPSPTFENLPLIVEPSFSQPPTPPQYPKRAKRKRLQGQVILRAHVDEQGAVKHIVVWQSSGHKLLDKAAERAMWDWHFTPARQAGVKTASWVEFPINFAIR